MSSKDWKQNIVKKHQKNISVLTVATLVYLEINLLPLKIFKVLLDAKLTGEGEGEKSPA